MKLARRSKSGVSIPSSAMSDIAFLLLLFFMVTTVVRSGSGLEITIPKAEATQRIRLRRKTTNVWVTSAGAVAIDDKVIANKDNFDPAKFANGILLKMSEHPDLVVILQIDKNARYGLVNELIDQLREVKALKVTFATKEEE